MMLSCQSHKKSLLVEHNNLESPGNRVYFLLANNDHFCGHKDITSVVVLESWLAAAV